MRHQTASAVPIITSDLTIEYPPHGASPAFVAVHGFNLRLAPGEVVGLLGESGSGKSTLARVLAGDAFMGEAAGIRPQITGGEATVLGFGLRRISKNALTRLRFGVGFLSQDAAVTLESTLTVAELVARPILERDRRYNRRALGARVATMIDSVRLPLAVLSQYPYELSSGQRQRVALAQALVLGPSLLIADEPTAGVDVLARDAVIDVISELQREQSFSALMISHDLAVLQRVANRIGVMHQGVLVGLGALDEVFRDPWHPYVRGLAQALHPAPEVAASMFHSDHGTGTTVESSGGPVERGDTPDES